MCSHARPGVTEAGLWPVVRGQGASGRSAQPEWCLRDLRRHHHHPAAMRTLSIWDVEPQCVQILAAFSQFSQTTVVALSRPSATWEASILDHSPHLPNLSGSWGCYSSRHPQPLLWALSNATAALSSPNHRVPRWTLPGRFLSPKVPIT